MNRAERRAMQFSSPAAHLRHTKTLQSATVRDSLNAAREFVRTFQAAIAPFTALCVNCIYPELRARSFNLSAGGRQWPQ